MTEETGESRNTNEPTAGPEMAAESEVEATEPNAVEQVVLPEKFYVGQDIDWDAPLRDVLLWVELPFWLMTNNGTVSVDVNGHSFDIATHDNYFELHAGGFEDSRNSVIYMGPVKPLDQFGQEVQEVRKDRPDLPLAWRKCKTVLKIATLCNEDIWQRGSPIGRPQSISMYLAELCRAHIPVVNQVIQGYRLATYDYFPFEVSPWDVPRWMIERDGDSIPGSLLPYKEWDIKPPVITGPGEKPVPYQLITAGDLAAQIDAEPTPGELELLDALNLMERGDYSGAVRRVTTAIEVIVEAVVGREIEKAQGTKAAKKFIRDTRTNFPRRVGKHEKLSGRAFPAALQRELDRTRKLRHRIVHGGYRIASGERGEAQRSVDTGRWIFNWFENDKTRFDVREKRIAFRGLGRDITYGTFPSDITPSGVVISSPPMGT
jgi:hypothetical protein